MENIARKGENASDQHVLCFVTDKLHVGQIYYLKIFSV